MRWRRFAPFRISYENVDATFAASAYVANPYAVPAAITCVSVWGLTAAVLLRQRNSRVALLFAAMIFLVGVWFFSFTLMYCATNPALAERWGRFGLAAIALLPPAVYDFTVTALRLHEKRKKWIVAAWIVAGVLSLLVLQTDWIFSGVRRFPWGFYPRTGRFAPLFLAFFFSVLVAHVVDYWREYHATTDPVRRRRVRDLIIAFLIVYSSAIDYLPMFGVNFYPLGFVGVLGFLLFSAGAIRGHRLTRITPATAAREILDTMADALFVVDQQMRIRVTNQAVSTLFGYSDLDLAGKSIETLQSPGSECEIRTILARGTVRDQECVFRSRSGELLDVSISASPLGSEEGTTAGTVVIARDIRERKKSEAELHDYNRRLQQSNRELEDFAHVASHDLQEPLRKIQAFGDRLRSKYDQTLGDDGKDYLARMQNAANRMQTLISDLLAFARVTTKAQPSLPVDLGAIAREVVSDLEERIHRTAGKVEISELPALEADPLQMRQLLQNLIGNALKFHRAGAPPYVSIRGHERDDGTAVVEVSDNGIGFDEKHLDRIFTIFQRLHGRSEYEGTGIGLAICRKIVERHGGTISARSAPGAGATFIVTLPRRQTEPT